MREFILAGNAEPRIGSFAVGQHCVDADAEFARDGLRAQSANDLGADLNLPVRQLRRDRAESIAILLKAILLAERWPDVVMLLENLGKQVGETRHDVEVAVAEAATGTIAVEVETNGVATMGPHDRKAVDEMHRAVTVATVGDILDFLVTQPDHRAKTCARIIVDDAVGWIERPVVLDVFRGQPAGDRQIAVIHREQNARRPPLGDGKGREMGTLDGLFGQRQHGPFEVRRSDCADEVTQALVGDLVRGSRVQKSNVHRVLPGGDCFGNHSIPDGPRSTIWPNDFHGHAAGTGRG